MCAFWWQDPERRRSYTFGIEHVVIWRNMVERHLSLPHRLVVVTDDPHAVENAGIEAIEIDWTKHVPGTCFVKLMLWRPDIAGILGDRLLYMDLDAVVVDSLDPLLSRADDVVLWRNPNYVAGGRRAFYQGSIQLLAAGVRPYLWSGFDPLETPKWVNRRFGGAEQAWISERLPWDEAYWTNADGIYGAGRLFNGEMTEGVQSELPANARVVFTPGNRMPDQAETREKHPWIQEHYR